MKLVFDCRYTRIGRHDGISRYTAELVTELAKLCDVTMLISDERQLVMLPDLPWVMGSAPTSLAEPWVPRFVNPLEPDVVFTPMQMMGSVGRRYRFILTLHDLIYYRSPTPPRDLSWPVRAGWRVYHWTYLPVRMLLRRADAIVTGSQTTRQEILDAGLTTRSMTVVSSGVRQEHPVADRARPVERMLVYMGSYMPYKNVETLARAMQHLPGYSLHLLSRASRKEQARLQTLAPAGTLVFHGGVSDDEYRELLARSTALLTASRDEGFGIPLVEAMSTGTPIVVSDIPVFHEIGGDAANYFDVDDPRSVADAVLRLDRDGEWERRSRLSVEQAASFTWERSARVLYDLAVEVTRTIPAPGRQRKQRAPSAGSTVQGPPDAEVRQTTGVAD